MTATAAKVVDLPEQPAPKEAEKPRNIYQRLVTLRLALAEAGGIGKGGTAPAVMGGFRFVTWEDVASKLGALFAANGVVPMVNMVDTTVEQIGETSNKKPIYRASVRLTITLVNADDPKDVVDFTWFGVGDDSGDKAVQKAVTSATKYGLMKLFMLGGAEDNDGATNEIATSTRPPLPPRTPPANQPARSGISDKALATKRIFDSLTDEEQSRPKWKIMTEAGYVKGFAGGATTFLAGLPDDKLDAVLRALKALDVGGEDMSPEPINDADIPF